MTFRVTILGNGSAMSTTHSHHSAHALNVHEQFYLVDCGEGTQRQLAKAGINPLKLKAIFISHLHGDHIYGLFPLISTMGLLGRREALRVFAPAPFGDVLEFHKRYFEKHLPFEVSWQEVDTRCSEIVYQNRVMEVWTLPLRHSIPSAGYYFKEKMPGLNVSKDVIGRYDLDIRQIVAAKNGEDITLTDGTIVANSEITHLPYAPRSYAYCSDTQYSARVAAIIEGVNLLYHEATFSHADRALSKQTGHSTALQAAKVATLAKASRLLIGHLSNRYKDPQELLAQARAQFPDTEIAQELGSYDVV